MELQLFQVVFVLTTLFGGVDARAILSRQTETKRPDQSLVQKLQNSGSSLPCLQGTLTKPPLASRKDVRSTIEQVIERPPRLMDRLAGLKEKARHRRYAKHNKRWYKFLLKWHIPSNGWATSLTNTEVNDTIAKAFRMWAEVSPLRFRWVDSASEADITVSFEAGNHGCNTGSFDGTGGQLAHAAFPGDSNVFIHFDDAEQWTISSGSSSSYSLLPVALHEIGHTIGLSHSSDSSAIMYQHYSTQSGSVSLSDDDVNGIQDIYGHCWLSFSSVSVYDGQPYMFNGPNMWRYDRGLNQSERGYPKAISSKWSGIPDPDLVDEMFYYAWNGRTYFFKNYQYFRISSSSDAIDTGYPMNIANGWPGLPDDIDAASQFDDGEYYFFKGDQVYQYDKVYDQVPSGWPKYISDHFPNLPNNIDSVFYNESPGGDGKVYIFKSDYYYTWHDDGTGQQREDMVSGPHLIPYTWRNICDV